MNRVTERKAHNTHHSPWFSRQPPAMRGGGRAANKRAAVEWVVMPREVEMCRWRCGVAWICSYTPTIFFVSLGGERRKGGGSQEEVPRRFKGRRKERRKIKAAAVGSIRLAHTINHTSAPEREQVARPSRHGCCYLAFFPRMITSGLQLQCQLHQEKKKFAAHDAPG